MYSEKKKRAVDPNAPPRPTLLGHNKIIKGVQADIDETRLISQQQQAQIDQLKAELRRANHRIELLTDHLRNKK